MMLLQTFDLLWTLCLGRCTQWRRQGESGGGEGSEGPTLSLIPLDNT